MLLAASPIAGVTRDWTAMMPALRRLAGSLDRVTRGWLTILAGDVGRLILGLGVSVLIARSLGPERFGVYALFGAVVAIGGVLGDAGLSQAANRYVAPMWQRDDRRAGQRGRAFFWWRVLLSSVVALAGLLLAQPLLALVGLETDGSTILLLAAALGGIVAGAASGSVATLLQATGRFKAITFLLLGNTGLTLLLAGILALLGRLTLLTALLVLGVVPSLAAFAAGRVMLPGRWSLRPPSWRELSRSASPFFRLSRWLLLSNLLAMLTLHLDLLLLNHLSNPTVVGTYGLALNLANRLDVINRSLHTVLLPTVSALETDDAIRQHVRQGLARSGLVFLLLLAAIPLAGPFIGVFYGAEYTGAVAPLSLLLLAMALETVALPLSLLAFPFDRPVWLVATNAVKVTLLLLGGVLLIPDSGAVGAAVARVGAHLGGVLVIVVLLARHFRGSDRSAR